MQPLQLPLINVYRGSLALPALLACIVSLNKLRWNARVFSSVSVFTTTSITFVAFQTQREPVSVAGIGDIRDVIFVPSAVWLTLSLPHVADRSGRFNAIEDDIQRFSVAPPSRYWHSTGSAVGNQSALVDVTLRTDTPGIISQQGNGIRIMIPGTVLGMVVFGLVLILLNGMVLVGGG